MLCSPFVDIRSDQGYAVFSVSRSLHCVFLTHTAVPFVSSQLDYLHQIEMRYLLVFLRCFALGTTTLRMFLGLPQNLNQVYLSASSETQVKPKVEAMLLDEIQLSEALEESLGKDEIDKELDAAFEAQGGEDADLSKAFPVPDTDQSGYKEAEVQDAEMA